jgi:hypothetical protein
MKNFVYLLIFYTLWALPGLHAQDPLSDCEIYLDELELQLKKDLRDTKKYYHIQLEEGNAIFEKDLQAINSSADRRELKAQYREFIEGLEKDYNREMDRLEESYIETLEDLKDDCGSQAIRRRIMKLYEPGYPYYQRPRG